MLKVPLKTSNAFLDITLHYVELIDSPLSVIPLFAGQEKVPLFSIRQDCHGHAGMKGIFKQLPLT